MKEIARSDIVEVHRVRCETETPIFHGRVKLIDVWIPAVVEHVDEHGIVQVRAIGELFHEDGSDHLILHPDSYGRLWR